MAAYEDGEIIAVRDPRDPIRIRYVEETVIPKRGAELKKCIIAKGERQLKTGEEHDLEAAWGEAMSSTAMSGGGISVRLSCKLCNFVSFCDITNTVKAWRVSSSPTPVCH
jgi:hypothetical protein